MTWNNVPLGSEVEIQVTGNGHFDAKGMFDSPDRSEDQNFSGAVQVTKKIFFRVSKLYYVIWADKDSNVTLNVSLKKNGNNVPGFLPKIEYSGGPDNAILKKICITITTIQPVDADLDPVALALEQKPQSNNWELIMERVKLPIGSPNRQLISSLPNEAFSGQKIKLYSEPF